MAPGSGPAPPSSLGWPQLQPPCSPLGECLEPYAAAPAYAAREGWQEEEGGDGGMWLSENTSKCFWLKRVRG